MSRIANPFPATAFRGSVRNILGTVNCPAILPPVVGSLSTSAGSELERLQDFLGSAVVFLLLSGLEQ